MQNLASIYKAEIQMYKQHIQNIINNRREWDVEEYQYYIEKVKDIEFKLEKYIKNN